MNLEIHRSKTGKNVFLDLIGDLDMGGAPILRQSVVQEVSKGNFFIVLDFSGINFLDSAGLGAIIGGLRRARSHEGDLVLIGLDDELQKIFKELNHTILRKMTHFCGKWCSCTVVYFYQSLNKGRELQI